MHSTPSTKHQRMVRFRQKNSKRGVSIWTPRCQRKMPCLSLQSWTRMETKELTLKSSTKPWAAAPPAGISSESLCLNSLTASRQNTVPRKMRTTHLIRIRRGSCPLRSSKLCVLTWNHQFRLKRQDLSSKSWKLSPEEFEALCADLEPPISPEEAGPLFKKLDVAPTNGEISPKEFFDAIGGPEKYGITVPEFKARAKRKHGTPKKAFDAMDKDGDGQISPEEFEEGCKNLDPPISKEEAAPLFNEIDKDSSGGIDPEEFYKAVGGPDEWAESPEEAAERAKKSKKSGNPLDMDG